jgi:hypothetical protein
MMTTITGTQAQALAAFIHTIRDDWDTTGILAALRTAKDRATAPELAQAAIRAAATPSNRTPAVIALAGKHWIQSTQTATPIPGAGIAPRCEVYGHDTEAAWSCRACRAERVETGRWPLGSRHHDAPTTAAPDARQRAAGTERDEETDR